MAIKSKTLPARSTILLINVLVSWIVYYVSTGDFLPDGGLPAVWLISAFGFWFFSLLSSPWFVPPRDALANTLGATAILLTTDLSSLFGVGPHLELLRWLAVAFDGIVGAFAIIALVQHDTNSGSPKALAAFRFSSILGRGEILYTPPALIGILAAYQDAPITEAWLIIFWVGFVILKFTENAWDIVANWRLDEKKNVVADDVGTIERIDHPNILRVRLNKAAMWKPGSLHIAAMSDGDIRFVMALFIQVQGSEVMGTGLCVASAQVEQIIPIGRVRLAHDSEKAATFIENLSGTKDAELIGFTVENSTIGTIRFEIASTSDLAEGDVIFARINARDVFYQILDAETSEENFDQNPRGTYIIKAAQLGCYDSGKGFLKYPWLPAMNSPLFWAKNREFGKTPLSADEFVVGDVPSTNIGIAARLSDLIEYHTAVLGITGTGKTELALDIVREAVTRKAKAFCVDFTGEYRARLSDLKPIFPTPEPARIKELEEKLFDAETGAYGAGKEKKILDDALKAMRNEIAKQISGFLTNDEEYLAVLELSEIANTKATLRLTEMYLSEIMAWARQNRKARQVLIALEEAHTIIPETHGSGFDYDTQSVVSRIGQIALQGRKYGVGLLVVSQRTALVSKTILSQCNTFFTHSLIDQTSLSFLEGVYSSQHVRLIPNLRFLECLAFGKGLRTERPILIRRKFDQAKKDASDNLKKPLQGNIAAALGEQTG
jgi:hypothetical protein